MTKEELQFRIQELRQHVQRLMPHDDSGWKVEGGIPRRGIFDYARTIIFGHELTVTELTLVRTWLTLDGCPGWTGVTCYVAASQPGKFTYLCRTTMDSSD